MSLSSATCLLCERIGYKQNSSSNEIKSYHQSASKSLEKYIKDFEEKESLKLAKSLRKNLLVRSEKGIRDDIEITEAKTFNLISNKSFVNDFDLYNLLIPEKSSILSELNHYYQLQKTHEENSSNFNQSLLSTNELNSQKEGPNDSILSSTLKKEAFELSHSTSLSEMFHNLTNNLSLHLNVEEILQEYEKAKKLVNNLKKPFQTISSNKITEMSTNLNKIYSLEDVEIFADDDMNLKSLISKSNSSDNKSFSQKDLNFTLLHDERYSDVFSSMIYSDLDSLFDIKDSTLSEDDDISAIMEDIERRKLILLSKYTDESCRTSAITCESPPSGRTSCTMFDLMSTSDILQQIKSRVKTAKGSRYRSCNEQSHVTSETCDSIEILKEELMKEFSEISDKYSETQDEKMCKSTGSVETLKNMIFAIQSNTIFSHSSNSLN